MVQSMEKLRDQKHIQRSPTGRGGVTRKAVGLTEGGELFKPVGDHGEGHKDGCWWDGRGKGRERGEEVGHVGWEGEGRDTLEQEEARVVAHKASREAGAGEHGATVKACHGCVVVGGKQGHGCGARWGCWRLGSPP